MQQRRCEARQGVKCLRQLHHDHIQHGNERSTKIDGQTAKRFLQIAEIIGELFCLACRRLGERFVHVCDRGFYDLGDGGDLLGFGAVFDDVRLFVGEIVTVAGKRGGAAVHDLAEHGGNADR